MLTTNQEGLHGRNNPVESSSPPGTLMDRVAYAQRLWASAFAEHKLPCPENAFFIRALSLFSMAEFEYAVGRTARKFPVKQPRRPPFTPYMDITKEFMEGPLFFWTAFDCRQQL